MIDAFDPVDWLRRFREAGGWYAVQGDKVHAGWMLDDEGNGEDLRPLCREVWREIENHEDRRAAVRRTIIG